MTSWPDDLATRVALLDQLPAPALLVEHERVVAANRDAQRLVGVPRKGGGLPVLELFEPADQDVVGRVLGLEPGDAAVAKVWRAVARPCHDPRRWVELALRPDGADDVLRLLLLRDVTDDVRHQAILEFTADATLVVDATGRLLWRSPNLAERWTGPDRVPVTNPVERVHPEDIPIVLDAFMRLLAVQGGQTRLVARARTYDADHLWETVELGFTNCLDDGYVDGVVITMRSLDEVRSIESLSRAEGEFVSLAEAAPVGILVGDLIGRIVYRNRVAHRLVGDGVHTLDERGWLRLIGVAHRTEAQVAVDAAQHDGIESTLTVSWATPHSSSGRANWLRLHVAPQFGGHGVPVGVIVTFEDVTDQVEARAETERLTRMLEASPDYVVVWRPDPWELLYANAVMRDLLSVPLPNGEPRRLRHFLDERGREKLLGDAVHQGSGSEVWRSETVVQHPTRGEVPVSALAVIQRDPMGAIDTVSLIASDITDLKQAQDRLTYMANHDTLTGLANRAMFTQHLELAMRRHERNRKGLAVMFCDLNGFKPVNDRLGHVAGDFVLNEVGRRLAASVRGADLLARVGGDEFVLLCEDVGEDEDGLLEIAERLQVALDRPILVGAEQIWLSLSVGVAVAGADVVPDPDELMILADHAMYAAKAAGARVPNIRWAKGWHDLDEDVTTFADAGEDHPGAPPAAPAEHDAEDGPEDPPQPPLVVPPPVP